ncbi:MAG: DUF3015 domain-containing protein [Salinisphaera sp.]|nr:DUF3015 domain-containing protein [Salinisphaera sp.]
MAVLAVLGLGGCAQLTVTSNTLVDGMARIADATTNAVAGTSDATTDTTRDIDASTHQARLAFMRSQMVLLRREAAAGGGEHVRALAQLMGKQNTQTFARNLQAHYGDIFVHGADADQVLSNVYSVFGRPPDMKNG